jgi:hypothetical protein
MSNPHIGSDFDSFLAEEGILAEVTETAGERVSFGPRCWWCANLLMGRTQCCDPKSKLD